MNQQSLSHKQTWPGLAALGAAALVVLLAALICTNGTLERSGEMIPGLVIGLASGLAMATVFLVGCKLLGIKLAPNWSRTLLLFVAAISIFDLAVFSPSPKWAPDLKFNWSGKIAMTIAAFAFVLVLRKGKGEDAGVTRKLVATRVNWKVLGIICALTFLLLTIETIFYSKEAKEYFWYEATLPGISEELQRGITFMLFAAAVTGRMSIRSLQQTKLIFVAIGCRIDRFRTWTLRDAVRELEGNT